MRFRLGVDIGGTFTDFVLLDELERRIHVGKRLTTPGNYLDAVLGGLEELLGQAGLQPPDLDGVVHGTTLVTNTVIERKGAPTALITTNGARDLVEIGSELRYDTYDLGIERPEPLVPRRLRREVKERLAPDGSILVDLDLSNLPELVADLRQEGISSIAVCLLHSYANPAHEQALGEALQEVFPEALVTLSSELVPEIREYERASTAIVNAYVQPLVKRYLTEMEEELDRRGVKGPLYLMLSQGGLASVSESTAAPVRLIESGPAGGAIAARFFGAAAGFDDLISFDMGGTTAKMCLINGGHPTRSHEFEAARVHRFKKGSGLPLRVPVIDMIEIGAGGGSIARVDQMGLLKVGPESAGADPGPACYSRGGNRPTVTDADVVLGYLDPAFFLGGQMRLDEASARRAVLEHVGDALGLDAVQAAAGIQEIVNESMATATRLHVAERGRDLRRYSLLAFGGAGPVHAYRLAQLLGLKRLICPFAAGAASALGFLVAPLTIEQVRSYVAPLDGLDWQRLRGLYSEMQDGATRALVELGVAAESIQFHRSAEMRFAGQGYEIEAPVPDGRLDDYRKDEMRNGFLDAYRQLFERAPETVPVEALTWRLVATSPRPEVRLEFGSNGRPAEKRKRSREVYFHELKGFASTAVYDRYQLAPGDAFDGPGVIEEHESTVVVGPGAKVLVDSALNLVIELPA